MSFSLNYPEKRQKNGTPGGIRTHDLLLRRQTLYPAELRVHTYCVTFNIYPLMENFKYTATFFSFHHCQEAFQGVYLQKLYFLF